MSTPTLNRIERAERCTEISWRKMHDILLGFGGAARGVRVLQPEKNHNTGEAWRITPASLTEENGTTCVSCALREKGDRPGVRSSIFPYEFAEGARKITAFLTRQQCKVYLI